MFSSDIAFRELVLFFFVSVFYRQLNNGDFHTVVDEYINMMKANFSLIASKLVNRKKLVNK